ncbi:hypothetical protein Tco_0758133 [Tanacetum coccineum]
MVLCSGRPPDTAYPLVGYDVSNLLTRQRIDYCSLNNISCSSNNTAYSAKSIRRIDLQKTYTAYSNQLNTAKRLMKTGTVTKPASEDGLHGSGDVINHISKVLEILEWIKIPNVDKNQLWLHVFPILLSGHAREWWDNEVKALFDAQEGNGIYNFEESNQYSPQIPVPVEYNTRDPNELCKSKEFTVVRYSIGPDEEFITLSPSKYDTWEKNPWEHVLHLP